MVVHPILPAGPTANGHIHHPSARVARQDEASVDEVVHFGVERDGYVSANNSTELKGVWGCALSRYWVVSTEETGVGVGLGTVWDLWLRATHAYVDYIIRFSFFDCHGCVAALFGGR